MRYRYVAMIVIASLSLGVVALAEDQSRPIAAFIRGDANGDGTFDALADSLFILSYGFQRGPTPLCLEAADVNGDGVFDALNDSLHALSYGFTPGSPPPAAPFPLCSFMGEELIPEVLGCETDTCGL